MDREDQITKMVNSLIEKLQAIENETAENKVSILIDASNSIDSILEVAYLFEEEEKTREWLEAEQDRKDLESQYWQSRQEG